MVLQVGALKHALLLLELPVLPPSIVCKLKELLHHNGRTNILHRYHSSGSYRQDTLRHITNKTHLGDLGHRQSPQAANRTVHPLSTKGQEKCPLPCKPPKLSRKHSQARLNSHLGHRLNMS